jgi:hypothetical protein
MMKYDFNATIKQAEKDYGLGKGEYFKVQEGDNKIRVLSACIPHQSEYKGTATFRFVAWIIDRRDGKVKLYFMPTTIMNAIGSLQLDSDYAFDEVPMPYDINIRAKNAGTKEVEYTVIPSPNRVPLTEAETIDFNSKPSIDEVVEKLAENQKSQPGVASEPTGSPSSKPQASGFAQTVADKTGGKYGVAPEEDESVNIEDIPY